MKTLRVAFLTSDGRDNLPEKYWNEPSLGTAPFALLQGFAGCPDVEVHVISCTQRGWPLPEKLADNIFFHGLRVSKIGWLRTGYQGCIRAVRNRLKEIRPDIVHGQGTERDCAISAVFSGFPNVVTIHGNMRLIARLNRARPFSYEWLAARLEAFTLPRTGGVVCITNYTRDAVADRAKKTWVVPNAADLKFFEVEAGLNPAGTPVILCIGAICPRKNQNTFIRALEPLARERKFQVVFLGGTLRGQAYDDDFFQLLGKNPWCSYAGTVHHEKLTDYLRDASLLALPSLEDNCPMVVLEAMAAGVPVVAANVGGVPELIEHAKTGLLCDPLDAAGMSGAVEKMLNQPELGHRLAAEANRLARERFHPAVIARRHLEIYREALNIM